MSPTSTLANGLQCSLQLQIIGTAQASMSKNNQWHVGKLGLESNGKRAFSAAGHIGHTDLPSRYSLHLSA